MSLSNLSSYNHLISNFQLLSYSQLCALTARFLACNTLSTPEKLSHLRDELPENIADNIVLPPSYNSRQEMLNIILACIRIDEGLKNLLEIVRYLESDTTTPFRELETCYNQLQPAPGTQVADEPIDQDWGQYLEDLIEDMRVRKSRLSQLSYAQSEVDYCTRQLEIWEKERNSIGLQAEAETVVNPVVISNSVEIRPFIIDGTSIEPWQKIVSQTVLEQHGEPQGFPLEQWASVPPSLELCKQSLYNSTHYIGLYTLERGSKLPGLNQTVPEVQFEWATEKAKPLATFVLDWQAPQSIELMQSQDKATTSQQMTFLSRVLANPDNKMFKDTTDLREKVTQQIQFWKNKSLLEQTLTQATPPAPKTLALDLSSLLDTMGWADSLQEFNVLLQELSGLPEYHNMACFVVHGPKLYGQSRLVKRLYQAVLQDNPARTQSNKGLRLVDLKSPVVNKNLGGVLKALQVPLTLEEWAETISREVGQEDVVVHLANAHFYESALPGLVDELWQPLVRLLLAHANFGPNRFFLIISQEKPLEEAYVSLLQKADLAPLPSFDVNRPISLKQLQPFEAGDLRGWLRKNRLIKLSADEEETLINQVLEDAEGQPDRVFDELYKALNALKGRDA